MKNLNTFINEQLITEHFVNCHNQEQMKQYAEDVWNKIDEYENRIAELESMTRSAGYGFEEKD